MKFILEWTVLDRNHPTDMFTLSIFNPIGVFILIICVHVKTAKD